MKAPSSVVQGNLTGEYKWAQRHASEQKATLLAIKKTKWRD